MISYWPGAFDVSGVSTIRTTLFSGMGGSSETVPSLRDFSLLPSCAPDECVRGSTFHSAAGAITTLLPLPALLSLPATLRRRGRCRRRGRRTRSVSCLRERDGHRPPSGRYLVRPPKLSPLEAPRLRFAWMETATR